MGASEVSGTARVADESRGTGQGEGDRTKAPGASEASRRRLIEILDEWRVLEEVIGDGETTSEQRQWIDRLSREHVALLEELHALDEEIRRRGTRP